MKIEIIANGLLEFQTNEIIKTLKTINAFSFLMFSHFPGNNNAFPISEQKRWWRDNRRAKLHVLAIPRMGIFLRFGILMDFGANISVMEGGC